MENIQLLYGIPMWILVILIVWEAFWKLLALWRAARNNHPIWFVCIGIINTAGILPIIYIILNCRKEMPKDF